MFTKRRLRFSIGAMLVVMTAVALLLNHEVQRAKAIDTTVKRIEAWHGQVGFGQRAYLPSVFSRLVPTYWAEEIHLVDLKLYSKEKPTPSLNVGQPGKDYAIIDPREFKELLDLGSLANLRKSHLGGTVINHAITFRICELPMMKEFELRDVGLSLEEIKSLRKSFPDCKFSIIPFVLYESEI